MAEATEAKIDFVLVGGGLASARAAETLRREGATGSIMILSAEQTLPYHRPALSKRYLLGQADESQILVHPQRYYDEQEIDVRLGTRAASIDTASQMVRTSSGLQIRYGKLLLATGAAPRPLVVPGASLPGIHALRCRSDCDAIRVAASTAKRAVVVGGSFLGMEVAISLLELGLEVTIIEAGGRVMRHLESTTVSAWTATIMLAGVAAKVLAGDVESEAALAAEGDASPAAPSRLGSTMADRIKKRSATCLEPALPTNRFASTCLNANIIRRRSPQRRLASAYAAPGA